MYSRLTELFEIELIIFIKMDLALNNLQRLICHKTHETFILIKDPSMFKQLFHHLHVRMKVYKNRDDLTSMFHINRVNALAIIGFWPIRLSNLINICEY